MTAVLDAGALVAVDRHDRKVGALLRVLQRNHVPVRTSAAALAGVWRTGAGHENLARLLPGIDVVALDGAASRRIGELLAASGTTNLVDAHVALLADPDGTVLTRDAAHIEELLRTRQTTVLRV